MLADKMKNFGTLLLFAVFLNIQGWRTFRIVCTKVAWEKYENLVDVNASVGKSGDINIFVHILEKIEYPLVQTEIYVDSGKSSYDFEVVNRTVDLCELFHNKLYEPLLQIFYKILLESGPWPRSCPIRKFSIENLIIDPEKLPMYLPERKGFVTLRFKNKENGTIKDLGFITIYFEVENTGMDRLKHNARKKNYTNGQ